MSATSSLFIVEPSLEHDVHSRSASVDLVLVTSIRTLEHPLHLTHTRLLQSTLPPRGGDLKETKRPPTSLVRGSRGTDVARLQLVYIILASPPPLPLPSPLRPCHYLVPLASTSTHPPLVQRYEYQRHPLRVPSYFSSPPLMIFTHLCPHPALLTHPS